jgi:hypothetical protein
VTPLLNFLSSLIQLPPDSLALLVGLSAIGLAASTILVVSRHRDGDR